MRDKVTQADQSPLTDQDPRDAHLGVSDRYHELYEDYYEHQDPRWRALGAQEKFNSLQALCGQEPRARVLEIGAGDGAISALMDAAGFCDELCVLDISSSGISKVKERALATLSEAQVFDGASVPYDDQSFDLVILSHVVEHLEHPRQLLYEASRVGKMVFIEVPLEDTRALSERYVPDHVGHINVYTRKSARRLLQTCGLEIKRERIYVPSWQIHLHSDGAKGLGKYLTKRVAWRLAPRLATHLFTYHAAFLAQRITPHQ